MKEKCTKTISGKERSVSVSSNYISIYLKKTAFIIIILFLVSFKNIYNWEYFFVVKNRKEEKKPWSESRSLLCEKITTRVLPVFNEWILSHYSLLINCLQLMLIMFCDLFRRRNLKQKSIARQTNNPQNWKDENKSDGKNWKNIWRSLYCLPWYYLILHANLDIFRVKSLAM